MSLIFDYTSRNGHNMVPPCSTQLDLPAELIRNACPQIEVSELEVVRHFTRQSQKNFSIDTHFYPLGSCTMKYNPKLANQLAMLDGFKNLHPHTPDNLSQGVLEVLYETQQMLAEVSGMQEVSLAPMAGAHGEFAGVAMIKAYHSAHGDHQRNEILIPDAAHGTNPATAAMAGYKVREIPTNLKTGDLDIDALKAALGPNTAGIMLTNPSTLGVFERQIGLVAKLVHEAGGLLYYDGANLNAILGKVRPGDMGFDVIHINLHKTFSTPHGGGGPGSGPVGVSSRLVPYLPNPRLVKTSQGYTWQTAHTSMGRLSAFYGNLGVILRAYVYMRLLGEEGMHRIAEFATLNANYLLKRLEAAGFTLAFPQRRASHEFILTLKKEADSYGTTAKDFGKRLLDYGVHAPTTYFPMLIAECLLIEPSETESKASLDAFVDIMCQILHEAQTQPELVTSAPHTMPCTRLDDVKAAKDLILIEPVSL